MINRIVIIGRLTRDPDVYSSDKGRCVTRLGLAYNRKYRKQGGELVEESHFFDVSAFGKLAELCRDNLRKGQRIAVEGRLNFDKWQGTDGRPRTAVNIVADTVQFLSPPQTREKRVEEEAHIPF